MSKSPLRAWIAYGICAVVWGSTYFGIALAIPVFTPYGLVACRYIPAGLLALALGRLSGEALPPRRDWLHLAIQGVLLLGFSNALVSWAEGRVPSGVTAVLCATTPLFFGLLDRERLGLRRWVGLLLGMGGVVLLARPEAGHRLDPLGGAAILLAVFLWAYGTLYGRKKIQGSGLMGNVGIQMLSGGLFAALLVPFTGGLTHAPMTLKAGLAVVYLLVFGSLIAYTAFGYLSRVWPPARMGTYTYLNPLVAVLLGSVYLREPLGLRTLAGMGVILLSIVLVQFRPKAQA